MVVLQYNEKLFTDRWGSVIRLLPGDPSNKSDSPKQTPLMMVDAIMSLQLPMSQLGATDSLYTLHLGTFRASFQSYSCSIACSGV